MRAADTETLAQLENLHDLTRREVQRPDANSNRALPAIQHLLDVALERSGSGPARHEARESQRLQLAEQWMRRHLDVRAPAGALADYLGMSGAPAPRSKQSPSASATATPATSPAPSPGFMATPLRSPPGRGPADTAGFPLSAAPARTNFPP
jgi:hypothetical protein